MKKRFHNGNKLLIGIIILLLIGILVFFIKYVQFENQKEKKDYCEEDSDCAIQQGGCCPEPRNKKFIINKFYFIDYSQCSECPKVIENTTVKCIRNKCTLVEK